MPDIKITLRILRYKPGRIEPPRYQEFSLEMDPESSVLDALEEIRFTQDASLMYRHSCHHSSCGTCACKINGRERLTCITKIKELNANTITLAPLDGFKGVSDLVVDISPFYDDISEDWSYLKESESSRTDQGPAGIGVNMRFEDCIECGACVASCPVTDKNKGFIGPAALAFLEACQQDDPHHWKEKTRGVLSLKRWYEKSAIERACQLAVSHQLFSYRSVKSICQHLAKQQPPVAGQGIILNPQGFHHDLSLYDQL